MERGVNINRTVTMKTNVIELRLTLFLVDRQTYADG